MMRTGREGASKQDDSMPFFGRQQEILKSALIHEPEKTPTCRTLGVRCHGLHSHAGVIGTIRC